MYEFCYNYVKLKYWQKTKLFYMDTDSFLVSIKTDEIYMDVTVDIEENLKKVIGFTKNELVEKSWKKLLDYKQKLTW